MESSRDGSDVTGKTGNKYRDFLNDLNALFQSVSFALPLLTLSEHVLPKIVVNFLSVLFIAFNSLSCTTANKRYQIIDSSTTSTFLVVRH